MIHGALTLPACMGGFCSVRGTCARHHQTDKADPAERLCAPTSHDGWAPIERHGNALVEHHALALLHAYEGRADEPKPIAFRDDTGEL